MSHIGVVGIFPRWWALSPLSTWSMMTSSNGNIFRVTGPLCGEFTGPGEFPAQRPVTQSFDVFFDLRLNKRLSEQSWGWWFETQSGSLWRHCNDGWQLPWRNIRILIQKSVNSRVALVTTMHMQSFTFQRQDRHGLQYIGKEPCGSIS